MRLFVLSPIYASTTQGSGSTPIVHYFAREWVKLGHDVHVFNTRARFPFLFYVLSRLFQHKLNTLFGSLVPTEVPNNEDYVIDGVIIHRVAIRKIIPHSRYSKQKIRRISNIIESGMHLYGVPDALIGHWHNPSLDIMLEMNRRVKVRTCIVLHENCFKMEKYYGPEVRSLLQEIDVIGFRNRNARSNFIHQYGQPKSSFIAYSGVSSVFLTSGLNFQPDFSHGVDSFVFVGSLIARKHPAIIIKALDISYKDKPYYMTYIGDGDEKNNIISEQCINSKGHISFTGRIAREAIIDYLKRSQVFVMISRGEIFGLVYLEAMSLGLIPIGSRNEGIDGIIIDGQNGFLCDAGDEEELTSIILRLRRMSATDLYQLSQNAKKTAHDFSDYNVAKHYLQSIFK